MHALHNPDEAQIDPAAVPAPTNVFQAEVLATNLAGLLEELEDMKRRAAKLGLPPITYTVGPGVPKVIPGRKEETPWETYEVPPLRTQAHVVTVVGHPPRINGWRLIGVITPMEHGNYLTPAPGADARALEPYRAANLTCHHCGYVRRRNETLVLQHDDGRTQQVGSDCARDYLGRKGVDELLKWAEWDHRLAQLMRAAAEEEDAFGGGGGGGERAISLEVFLAAVWRAIREKGWITSTKARDEGLHPTWARALDLIEKGRKDPAHRPYEADDLSHARSAIEEARLRLETAATQGTIEAGYETNLLAVLRNGFVIGRSTALAASLYAHLDRVHERESRAERESKAQTAGYFGKVGDRGTWLATIEYTFHYEGAYGPGTGVVFFLDSGHRAMWFASGHQNLQRGERVAITASIKKHEPDKRSGVPTTLLTRVVIQDPAEAAAKIGKVKAKKEPGKAKPGSVAALKEALKAKLSQRAWVHMREWASRCGLVVPWNWVSDRSIKALKKDELAHWFNVLEFVEEDRCPAPGDPVLRDPIQPAVMQVEVRSVPQGARDADVFLLRFTADGLLVSTVVSYLGEASWVPPFGEHAYLHQVADWVAPGYYSRTPLQPGEVREVRVDPSMPWLSAASEKGSDKSLLAQLIDQAKALWGFTS